LTQKFGEEWPAEQLEHDEILDKYDETPSIVNTVLEEALQNHSFGLESVIFALTPRQRSLALRIDSHSLASVFSNMVQQIFSYKHRLSFRNSTAVSGTLKRTQFSR
jgi:hypothetical protein